MTIVVNLEYSDIPAITPISSQHNPAEGQVTLAP